MAKTQIQFYNTDGTLCIINSITELKDTSRFPEGMYLRFSNQRDKFLEKYNCSELDYNNIDMMTAYMRFISNPENNKSLLSKIVLNQVELMIANSIITSAASNAGLVVSPLVEGDTLHLLYLKLKDLNTNNLDIPSRIYSKYVEHAKNNNIVDLSKILYADKSPVYKNKADTRLIYNDKKWYNSIFELLEAYNIRTEISDDIIKSIYYYNIHNKNYDVDIDGYLKIVRDVVDDIAKSDLSKYIRFKPNGSPVRYVRYNILLSDNNIKLSSDEIKYIMQNPIEKRYTELTKLVKLYSGGGDIQCIKYICTDIDGNRLYMIKDNTKSGDAMYDVLKLRDIAILMNKDK